MSDELTRNTLSGILGEMVELGKQRGAVPVGGQRTRQPVAAQICPSCGAEVVAKPLVSGRVFRCSGCAKSWAGPPASTISTLDPFDPRTVPEPVAPIEMDHLAVDARPFRVNAVDKE